MTQHDTYTPEQVAELAGVTRRTVYRWIVSERLPAHKIGPKMWVIYRQVLMAFMAGKETEKLHNMAASLQGRKTVMTPAPAPGPVAEPNDVQAQPVAERYMTAYELSQAKLAEMEQEARATNPDRGSERERPRTMVTNLDGVRPAYNPLSHYSHNDTDFVQPAKRGTNMQPPKKKKPRR